MEKLPKRKPNRLPEYDYSTPGAYFVTVCTAGKRCILSSVSRGTVVLLPAGKAACDAVAAIKAAYPSVAVDHYVVMPNHVHMIISIHADEYGEPADSPTVSRIVRHFKAYVSRHAGFSVWQKSFYDRVIRSGDEYTQTAEYIIGNPLKWGVDEFYADCQA